MSSVLFEPYSPFTTSNNLGSYPRLGLHPFCSELQEDLYSEGAHICSYLGCECIYFVEVFNDMTYIQSNEADGRET